MYKLSSLLVRTDYSVIKGSADTDITEVVTDSRKAVPGCLFICISGYKSDGHDYIEDVVSKGAAALVVEKDSDPQKYGDATVIKVADSRLAMAYISDAYFGNPSSKLKVIGVTGTKGKTTTTYMIKSVLEKAGFKVGLIGTIEIIIGDEHISAVNTTPESFALHGYLKRMVDAGMDVVVMETASQGFKLKRTAGIMFDIGLFTNLEPDHISPTEHESFEDYLQCKSMLFRQCKTGIINADDPNALKIIKDHTCSIETYGFNKECDIYADDLKLLREPGKLGISFDTKGIKNLSVSVPTPGRFSVYNALAAISVCAHFDVDDETIKNALSSAYVKGRVEIVPVPYDMTLIIDYAHNAMSLKSILTTLREYDPSRLVCLFGCGGERAKERRYSMGEVSGNLADLTIITSDNPRGEEPSAIIEDIKTGINRTSGKYVEIIDRKDAIRYAINNHKKGDIVVLAGKGHEDYQEIKGVKYPMDERVLIKEILKEEQ